MDFSAESWLDVVQREYLRKFVPAGGAAVKFVVADEGGRAEVRAGLRRAAEAGGFQFAFVDAAQTRVQMIDKLFHEVARQVDWDALAGAFLARLLIEHGYSLPGEGRVALRAVAELNDLPEAQIRLQVSRLLWDRLFRDYGMSQEFRLAQVRLCRAQLDPDDEPLVTEATREWLRGELRLLSGVKRALIFQKIARHNARHMLASLTHWLRLVGRSGLILALDISRCLFAVRPSEREAGSVYYSSPATLDAYEVLRQLIDGTDELEGCYVAVLTGVEFLVDERRGLRRYDALYLRVADEVRDRARQNPLAALVRVRGPASGQGTPSPTPDVRPLTPGDADG